MVVKRTLKAVVLAYFGPISAVLVSEALDHAERRDWIGAAAYVATIPAGLFLLAQLTAILWTR